MMQTDRRPTDRRPTNRRWLAIGIVLVAAVVAAVLLFTLTGGDGMGSGDGGGLYVALLTLPAALMARDRS